MIGEEVVLELRKLSKKWKESRAHTYASENADHYRGFDAGQFRAAEEVDRLIERYEKEKFGNYTLDKWRQR